MRIGIPKEEKFDERRVALAPAGVDSLIRAGHTVYIESGAGERSHFTNEDYEELGAKIVFRTDEVYQRSECILKIGTINEQEAELLQENQVVFSFLHLAVSSRKVLQTLLEKKITAISYELIEEDDHLPVLYSISEIAGQLSVQAAENMLGAASEYSRGILLGGITGVAPAAVVVLGAGVVGRNAAYTALGKGAEVILLDTDLNRLRFVDQLFLKKVTTVYANPFTIERGVKFADVLIGAINIKGEKTPHIVTEDMVKQMKSGAVIVDVSIDQGGCIETSRPTSLSSPFYVQHNVIHYCVPNMPAMVPRTASYGLTNVALPFIHSVADNGIEEALKDSEALKAAVCTFGGYCSNSALAEISNTEYRRIHIFSNN